VQWVARWLAVAVLFVDDDTELRMYLPKSEEDMHFCFCDGSFGNKLQAVRNCK